MTEPFSAWKSRPKILAACAVVAAVSVAALGVGQPWNSPGVATRGTPAESAKVSIDQVGASRSAADREGPHAPANREQASTTTREVNGAIVRTVDLGNLDLGPAADPGRFRAPVRGVLVTPADANNSPLILINHLRYPACEEMQLAYPCAKGEEMRFDVGMEYLGESLARAGYSSLIPDLSPLYISGALEQPYNQKTGLSRTVTRLLDELESANDGRASRFGGGLNGAVDTSRIGLLTHSRSVTLAPDLAKALQGTDSKVVSVLGYGGAFDTEYGSRGGLEVAPMPADVPFLGVVGEMDNDVDYMGSLYMSYYIGQSRTAPALMGVVPGLGHTFVNRTLSAAKMDDRRCLENCPSAAEHEKFLTDTARDWFDATMRDRPVGDFPMTSTAKFPATLSGLPVRWTAITNGTRTNVFLAGKKGSLQRFGPKGRVVSCWPAEPMAPSVKSSCRVPDRGVTQNASKVSQVRLTNDSGASLKLPRTRGVKAVALQLSPTDDRADQRAGNPLIVTLRATDGRTFRVSADPRDSALRNRSTSLENGVYPITTVRLMLPRAATAATLTSLRLQGTRTGSLFNVRAIDLVR